MVQQYDYARSFQGRYDAVTGQPASGERARPMLAVAGYSWGGISNVFAAARDSRISALINLDGSVRFLPAKRFTEYSRAEVSQSHSWMARYALQFADAYLKGDARTSTGPAPTQEMLAAEAAKSGFGQLQQVYEGMRKRDAKFEIEESSLNEWGYALLRRKEPQAAIAVLKLATVLHPDSGNAYDSLAEAYESIQDKAQAISNYQRALQLDPKNDNAVLHLKELGAPQ